MDLITTAITAALSSLAVTGVQDAYETLKATLRRKYGQESDLIDAVEKVEKRPDSKGRQETLQEEVELAGADKDDEILEKARELIQLVNPQQATGPINQQINNNAPIDKQTIAGKVDTLTIN